MTSDDLEASRAGDAPSVVVVDDDPLARRALDEAFRRAGFRVLGDAADATEGVKLARERRPDVVVMDVIMPGVDGLEATRTLRDDAPDVAVLLLTSSTDDDLAMAGLRNGATGFIRKDSDPAVVAEAVRDAAAGTIVVPPAIVERLVEQMRTTPAGGVGLRPVHSELTDREWEVLDALTSGGTQEAIADTLVVSLETVRTHLKNIYRKLGVHSRAEALAAAAKLRQAP